MLYCMPQIVDIMRTEILPHSAELPKDFTVSLIQLLNKGSVHSQCSGEDVWLVVRLLSLNTFYVFVCE